MNGRTGFAAHAVSNAAIVEGGGLVRIELDGLAVVFDGARKVALGPVGGSAVEEGRDKLLAGIPSRLDRLGASGDLLIPWDAGTTGAFRVLQRLCRSGRRHRRQPHHRCQKHQRARERGPHHRLLHRSSSRRLSGCRFDAPRSDEVQRCRLLLAEKRRRLGRPCRRQTRSLRR